MNNKILQPLNSKEICAFFHSCPELSGHEVKTHQRIVELLQLLNPTKLYTHLGGFGVLAEFTFAKPGKTILFRADIDAVGSTPENVKHICGHDGHTTVLLDFAYQLAKQPLPQGRILLLFQPSEENGKGAQAVINSNILERFNIDFAFAMHNIPEFPLGTVLCKSESFSCAVLSCEMRFVGKSAHASEPEKSVSPQVVIFEIINRIQKLQNPDFASADFFLATLIELHIGEETYGVAPGNGLMRWTFRSKTNAVLQQKIFEIETFSKQVTAQTSDLQFSTRYLEAFFANENDPETVEIVSKAAFKLGFNYQQLENGFRWGEDFGLFTQQIPGAMFGLGAGTTCPPLHSDDYQFPDKLIEIGSKMFYQIAESCLGA